MDLFGGTSNPELTLEVCNYLEIEPGQIIAKTFSDGETQIDIGENVRGQDIFILQSTCPPVNDNLMQLLIIIDALKRASAKRITAVIPYYGYGRQDRKVRPRAPISAKLVADLITVAGAHRVVAMDLHAGQIQGYFNIPVDNIFAAPVILKYVQNESIEDLVIVSPDAGGVERARALAKRLEVSIAIIDKRRESPNVAQVMNIVGNVSGKNCFLLDDMVDTGGSLVKAAAALKDHGAKTVYACATHPVLSGDAVQKITTSQIDRLIVTNTIPLKPEAKDCGKILCLSIAELLGETIKRIYHSYSVSTLFI